MGKIDGIAWLSQRESDGISRGLGRREFVKTIVCATDLSLRAALAVDRADLLARQHLARLLLLHVADDDQPRPIVDAELAGARETLETRITELKDHDGPGIEIVVRPGTVFQTIVSVAQTEDADLVVMGAHRKRILKDVVIGTTIERVMRTGRHPVLMVNTAANARYESVLLALDGSEASAHALGAARSLRLLDDVRLSVISAFEAVYKGMLAWAGLQQRTITEYSELWASETRGEIRKLLEQAGLHAMPFQVLTEEGAPFVVVHRAVARLRPDLLVIGTQGRMGMKRALLGSVAERVIREVDCDVLVVPSGRNA